MADLRAARKIAAKFKATLVDEKDARNHECRAEAPHGFVWAGDGLHELIAAAYRPWKPDYDDIISRMEHGVEPCPDGDECEWCNPEES